MARGHYHHAVWMAHTVEERGGGKGVVEGVVHEGGTGAGGGVDGNQKPVQMMGRRALRGVFGPALPHDVEEGRGETGGAWRERVWNLWREAVLDKGHQNGVVLVLERHLAKRQRPRDDADGVHVGAIVRGGAMEVPEQLRYKNFRGGPI